MLTLCQSWEFNNKNIYNITIYNIKKEEPLCVPYIMAYILTINCMLFRLRNMYSAFSLSELKCNYCVWC